MFIYGLGLRVRANLIIFLGQLRALNGSKFARKKESIEGNGLKQKEHAVSFSVGFVVILQIPCHFYYHFLKNFCSMLFSSYVC